MCGSHQRPCAEEGLNEDRGGLHTLFTMILGGLVGASPHMISASVMALARLLYEFAPQLETTAPQLLPVVLSLLRSKSREVIKSVLGFVKVAPPPFPASACHVSPPLGPSRLTLCLFPAMLSAVRVKQSTPPLPPPPHPSCPC